MGRLKPKSHRVVFVKLQIGVQRGSSKRKEPIAGGLLCARKTGAEWLGGRKSWPASGDAGKTALIKGLRDWTVKKGIGAI